MMDVNTCRSCGGANPPGAQFCQCCGRMLQSHGDGRTVVIAPMPSHFTPATRASFVGATGIPRAIQEPCAAGQRELLFFVNDISTSMAGPYDSRHTKIEVSNRAAGTLVVQKAQIDPDDEVGLIIFNSRAQLLMPLSPLRTHRSQLLQMIQQLQPDDGTDINEGLKAARDAFGWNRQGVVRRVVLLTDGQGGEPLRTAADLKSRGVIIDVIGIGPDPSAVDEKLLRKVASTVEGELRYRFIRDQQTLVSHYTQLANKTVVSVR